MEFPHPLLVCDIGGTNVRMAFVPEGGVEPIPLRARQTADFPDFDTCLADAFEELGAQPRSLVVCGAGPVVGRSLHLTNGAWSLDGPRIAYRFGLSQGLLLNDFEAQALSLPTHRPEWLQSIGGPVRPKEGLRLILGPGTGLGVAGLICDAGCHRPLPSEAAHAAFAPTSPEEIEIWSRLQPPFGRITAETLVSGPGLVRLHEARSSILLSGQEIVARALQNAEGLEAQTLRHFWQLVARVAGDLALTFLARGGVTLSGGILPKITSFLDAKTFRESFEDKAPMKTLSQTISTDLLIAKDAVLMGMAAIAANPQAYVIDYKLRAWR